MDMHGRTTVTDLVPCREAQASRALTFQPTTNVVSRKLPPVGKRQAVHGRWACLWRWERTQSIPQFADAWPTSRQHAVLKAIQVLPVDGWHEFAREQAKKHFGRDIVLPYAMTHLEVLVEHGLEVQRNKLQNVNEC